ncbi:MAG: hypothetical protein AB1489_07115 [Acidobacteriota bacterium]
MAEKTKLKWLRKEFNSSEELEYYLAQLKHQDKLKSDIISLLQRFQHLLFASYEPDFLAITYNGQWDVSFTPLSSEEIKERNLKSSSTLPVAKPVAPPSAKASRSLVAAKTKSLAADKRKPRVALKDLIEAQLLNVGARLKHKSLPSLVATVTREGHLRIGKQEYQSLSGAATSFAPSGRRDGWFCWLFQDQDGSWKPIDLLRDRWRANH